MLPDSSHAKPLPSAHSPPLLFLTLLPTCTHQVLTEPPRHKFVMNPSSCFAPESNTWRVNLQDWLQSWSTISHSVKQEPFGTFLKPGTTSRQVNCWTMWTSSRILAAMALVISLESTTLSQLIPCLPAATYSTSTKAAELQHKVVHPHSTAVCRLPYTTSLSSPTACLITLNGLKFLKHARLVLNISVLQACTLFCLKDLLLCSRPHLLQFYSLHNLFLVNPHPKFIWFCLRIMFIVVPLQTCNPSFIPQLL